MGRLATHPLTLMVKWVAKSGTREHAETWRHISSQRLPVWFPACSGYVHCLVCCHWYIYIQIIYIRFQSIATASSHSRLQPYSSMLATCKSHQGVRHWLSLSWTSFSERVPINTCCIRGQGCQVSLLGVDDRLQDGQISSDGLVSTDAIKYTSGRVTTWW